MAKKNPPRGWVLSASKNAKAPLSDTTKADLDAKAKKLVEGVLKPRYVTPPPQKAMFNYVTDVWIKWVGSAMYFGATFACPGPTAMFPSFETRFARLEHVGGGRFTLSYMRHNDKWFRLSWNLTADECLDAVENDCHFQLI